MSSTTGKNVTEGEFYRTPEHTIQSIIPFLVNPVTKTSLLFSGSKILDAGCGDGAITSCLIKNGANEQDIHCLDLGIVLLNMLTRKHPKVTSYNCDFLTFQTNIKFNLVIMNPPFSLAEDFIGHSIDNLLAPQGICVALTRIAFPLPQKKKSFRAKYKYDKFELSKRPRFIVGKSGDSADYAWHRFDLLGSCGYFEVL